MSQNDLILRHLKHVGSITFLEAVDLYRVRSLPRRIKDLVTLVTKLSAVAERHAGPNTPVTA